MQKVSYALPPSDEGGGFLRSKKTEGEKKVTTHQWDVASLPRQRMNPFPTQPPVAKKEPPLKAGVLMKDLFQVCLQGRKFSFQLSRQLVAELAVELFDAGSFFRPQCLVHF